MTLEPFLSDALQKAHSSWRPHLVEGLTRMMAADPSYFDDLKKTGFLPTENRLFAAFSLPVDEVRFILVGESPYPREESATGYSFMDGAVREIWSETGFSKEVNRATSLRNFLKMLLVAEKTLLSDDTGAKAIARVRSQSIGRNVPHITQLYELQENFQNQGFLLLNASPVFRRHVLPSKEAKAWLPFLNVVLDTLARHKEALKTPLPVLILWGNAAKKLETVEAAFAFPKIKSEHPYNLSFIQNLEMQNLFAPANLLVSGKNRQC